MQRIEELLDRLSMNEQKKTEKNGTICGEYEN